MEAGLSVLEMQLNSVPVLPWQPANNGYFIFIRNPADALECLTQNRAFSNQLKFVVGLLIVAASAICEILAPRNHSLGRSSNHLGSNATEKSGFHPFRPDQY